jgi:hypothetical protein
MSVTTASVNSFIHFPCLYTLLDLKEKQYIENFAFSFYLYGISVLEDHGNLEYIKSGMHRCMPGIQTSLNIYI